MKDTKEAGVGVADVDHPGAVGALQPGVEVWLRRLARKLGQWAVEGMRVVGGMS